jgi:hypothetical protein
MNKKNKQGEILIENIVFIILNIIFLAILVLFLLKQGEGAVVLEGAYAKETALLIDAAKPGMIFTINMEKAMEIANENEIDFSEVVEVGNNYVTVKLTDKGGYKYTFFNDVNVSAYPDRNKENNYNGIYVFTVSLK